MQAQKAKEQTEQASEDEAEILNDYESKINETLGMKAQAEPGKYYEKDTDVIVGEKTVTIPGGSSVSKIPGEYEDVDNGFVIYITNKEITDDEWADVEKMQKEYDQFVWIPVTNEEEYKRNEKYNEVNDSENAYTPSGYLPEEIQPEIQDGMTDEEIGRLNEDAERKAVLNAKGFYISRYEVGEEVVSRKGVHIYVYSGFENISAIAKNFMGNTNDFKSALCTGIQWDVVMDFVNGKLDGNNEIFDVEVPNEKRHTERTISGNNKADKVCNIYDLEGNHFELVAEGRKVRGKYTDSQRGGEGTSSSVLPASYRTISNAVLTGIETFRIVLYII